MTASTSSSPQGAIAERVSGFITEQLLLGREENLSAIPSFLEAGIIDSTGVLELVQFLEDEWDFKVADAEMLPDNLDSIAKIVAFVQKKTAARA
jgi:acyl carrier protein